ncbi:MAG: PTS sugar transporter subunit IIA [Tepidisphaerales bacterium]
MTLKLKDFIIADAVIPSLTATTRDDALREMVNALAQCGALDPGVVNEVVQALIKREQAGSTGFGKGIAVPHVKHPKVKRMVGTVARSAQGIDFAALDHQPVYSLVLLLSPDTAPEQHLKAMNIVFSNLQKDMFRKFLRQADTKQKILDLLDEADSAAK